MWYRAYEPDMDAIERLRDSCDRAVYLDVGEALDR
jgi:hypothetical protein